MKTLIFILTVGIILIAFFLLKSNDKINVPEGESMPVITSPKDPAGPTIATKSSRQIFETDGVKHSVPLDEIRQGCFGRDCIPSVENPKFISVKEAQEILDAKDIGIGLNHKGEQRFYSFNMLVTKEIVNDTIAGNPVLVTYCPLCGTGIVFDRVVNGVTQEFGVSGMLWQSNLLMYNRAEKEDDISLWSQVLGEAVLGINTGDKLEIISSDIVQFENWTSKHPETKVLDTGKIGDPYNGAYYEVASSFEPNFDEDSSPLEPSEYVFGLEINNQFKAYPRKDILGGQTRDTFAGKNIIIEKDEIGTVRFYEEGKTKDLNIVTGFWFSWVAAHPETELLK